jgi:signal transduction histidine kinase
MAAATSGSESEHLNQKSGPPVIKIEVSDHGSESRQEVEHIFEPFFRGNEARSRQIRGNGLGLSIVNHIVAAHSGTVRVESTSGTGTTFIVTLPVAVREATSERTATLPDYEQANTAG